MKNEIKIKVPKDILNLMEKWKNRREENFLAITLNGAHYVLRVHHITKGLLNKTIVHPRECYFPVIRDYAAAVVFVHNHPSGVTEPSYEDNEITLRLCMAGRILGIHVVDHIIISPFDNYYSYAEAKEIKYEFKNYQLYGFVETLNAGLL